MILILLISIISIFIGKQKLFVIILLPVFWASLISILFSIYNNKKNIINNSKILKYSEISMIGLLLIAVKYGTLVGPHLYEILNLSIVFIFQELGQILIPIIAMPLGLLLGMNKMALGACSSLCREPALGIIGEEYSMNSEEGSGVISMYIMGYFIAPIFFTIIGSIAKYTGFNPISLAMACGLGSTTMLISVSSALSETLPDFSNMIYTYGVASTMLSAITDVLIMNFFQLPISKFIYKRMKNDKKYK